MKKITQKQLIEAMKFNPEDGSFGYIMEHDNNMNLDLTGHDEMICKMQSKGLLVYDMAHDIIVIPGSIDLALEWNKNNDI